VSSSPAHHRSLVNTQSGGVTVMLLWLVLLWLVLLSVAIGASVYIWQVLYNSPADGQGLIKLTDIRTVRKVDKLSLQANADVELSSAIQAGLYSGVPLTFVLSFRVVESRRWWFDSVVMDRKQHYHLTYYELTRHYRVHAVEMDVSRNFRSLSSALAGLGKLERVVFDLNDQQTLKFEHSSLMGSLEMRLSKSALPLPLQPIIRSSWTLLSEEYRWPVT